MLEAQVRCVGLAPLFLNPMSDETLMNIRKKNPSQQKRTWTPEEEARAQLILNDEGVICLTRGMLLPSIIAAGQHVGLAGKSKVSTKEETRLFRYDIAFDLVGEYFPLFNPETGKPLKDVAGKDWIVDMRRGVGKQASTPTAVCITRPLIPVWGFIPTFRFNEDALHPTKFLELLRIAGSISAIGGFRPSKGRGEFGRFRPVDIDAKKIPNPLEQVTFKIDGVEVPLVEPPTKKAKKGKKTAAEDEPKEAEVA